jgi:hypothetical protein
MFEKGYEFREVNSRKGQRINEPYEKEYLFTFKGKNKCPYMVRVQEFSHHFCAIKFHLERDQDKGEKKYQVLTNLKDATRIIRTCVDIMAYMYNKNPYRSFGFIGSNSEGESEVNTTRFRIYKQVMENLFSPEKFFHITNFSAICYLLINKDNPTKDLVKEVTLMLLSNYIFKKYHS